MGKKLPYTPNSKIKAALRMLWLRSRERLAALKRDGYTCQGCGNKQSRAKGKEFYVEVHHKDGVCNWDEIYSVIRKNLLCDPALLETLCDECHEKADPDRFTGSSLPALPVKLIAVDVLSFVPEGSGK